MQSLNEFIAESVANKDIKALEQVEWELSEVIEFTRKRTLNLMFYKQAVINRLLVQNAIIKVLWKQ
jgi:hypothetical protein